MSLWGTDIFRDFMDQKEKERILRSALGRRKNDNAASPSKDPAAIKRKKRRQAEKKARKVNRKR